MTVLISLALLVFTAALVLLYAMVGELASRVPRAAQEDGRADFVTPLTELDPGTVPADWPGQLAALQGEERAVLLVLSPSCSSCNRVAGELATMGEGEFGLPLGVVVSSGDRRTGEEFAARHGLHRLPCLVDERGAWVTGSFGVRTSPAALVITRGVAAEAYVFGGLRTVRDTIVRTTPEGAR
ncbi:MAG TPA: hypothetical protein VFH77_01825 [Streptomyces sp.]|jgi:hypothetical protein|nr:hypothetical protein [Streptomyces sp.]